MRKSYLIALLACVSAHCMAEPADPFENIAQGLNKVGDKKQIKSIMRVRDQTACFQLVMTVERTGDVPFEGKFLPVVKTSSVCTPVACPSESEIQIVRGNACETIAPVPPKSVTTIHTGPVDPSKVVIPKSNMTTGQSVSPGATSR
jgi:hypothetical protein